LLAAVFFSPLIKNLTNPTISLVFRMNKRFLLVGFMVAFLTITRPMLARTPTIRAKLWLLVGFVVGCWSGYETLIRPERWYGKLISRRFSRFVVGLVGSCREGREKIPPEV